MEAEKWVYSLISCNGSVLYTCNIREEDQIHSVKIISFTFNNEKCVFSPISEYSPIITHDNIGKTVCFCTKTCNIVPKNELRSFFIVGDSQSHRCCIFHLDNNNLQELATFSFQEIGPNNNQATFNPHDPGRNDLPDSQICTQVFSTLRTQTQGRLTQLDRNVLSSGHSGLSIDSLLLLEGPTLCIFSKEKLYLSGVPWPCLEESRTSKAITFTETNFNSVLKGLCLLWVGRFQNHTILLGTVSEIPSKRQAKSRHTNAAIHSQRSSWHNESFCSHQTHSIGSTTACGRKLVAVRIELNSEQNGHTQVCERPAESLQSADFMPNIYGGVAVCVTVEISNVIRKSTVTEKSTNEQRPDECDLSTWMYSNCTYICTTLKQLVYFKDGYIQDCVSIPSDSACEIQRFDTFSGQSYLSITTTDNTVMLVNNDKFEVVRVISNVYCLLIDDFILNGADQLLLLLDPLDDIAKKRELGHFILTDCEGVHLEYGQDHNKRKEDDVHTESLSSAIQALHTRQQVAYGSLHEAQQLVDKKQKLIQQTCDSLSKMCLGENNKSLYKPENLVPLIKSENLVIKRHVNPPATPSLQLTNVSQTMRCTQATQMCTQVLPDVPDVQGPRHVQTHVPVIHTVETWHRLTTPDTMIVGVKIVNHTKSAIKDMNLTLVNDTQEGPSYSDSAFHSKALCIAYSNQQASPTIGEPQPKRPRSQRLVKTCHMNSLPAGKACHVVAQTVIPKFDHHSEQSFSVLLTYEADRTADPCCRTLSHQCGTVTISIHDVLQHGSSWLNLYRLVEPGDLDVHTLLCLEAVQQTRSLQIKSLFTDTAEELYKALRLLGFQQSYHIQCMICVSEGEVQWSRTRVMSQTRHTVHMEVSTRNDDQLILLTHSLYGKLPDDVIIEASNQEAVSSAMARCVQCVCEEITSTETGLHHLLQTKSSTEPQEICTDLNSTRTLFEQRRNVMLHKEHESVNNTKLGEFKQKRSVTRENTNSAVYDLVDVLKL